MAQTRRAASAQAAPLPYAGLQLRIVAFILDVLVLISFGMLFAAGTGAYLVVDSRMNDGNLSNHAPYVAVAVFLIYVLAFLPLYHVLLWMWWGQTVGKMAVHIRVQSQEDGALTFGRSVLRFLGYVVSVAPLFLGLIMALFDRRRRALHDRLARTVVVEVP